MKKTIRPGVEKDNNFAWRVAILVSASVFLLTRFFADGLSYPVFNFWWNIFFFALFAVQLFRERCGKGLLREEAAILLFFLFSVISSGFSPVKAAGGILFNSQMLAYACFFSLLARNLKERETGILYRVLLFSALCISFYGIYQYFWGLEETRRLVHSNPELMKNLPPTFIDRLESKRIFATFVYPNVYASFLLFILPVSFFMFLSENRGFARFFCLGVTALAFFNLLLTGSLGGLLICLFISVIMLMYLLIKNRKSLILAILGFLFVISLASIGGLASGRAPKISSLADRGGYWQAAVRIFMENPVLGAGPGNYMHSYTRFKRPKSMEAKHAHSIFFETLAETGAVGTVLLFGFLFMAAAALFRKGWEKSVLPGLGFAFIAFFLHNLMDFDFVNPAVSALFFLAGGTAVSLGGGKRIEAGAGLTKVLNCLIIITVFLTASNYARYTLAARHIALSYEAASAGGRLFHVDRAIKLFPDNFEAYEKKGDVYFAEGIARKDKMHFIRAAMHYKKAASLNPLSPGVYRKMAMMYEQSGEYGLAEKMYLKLMELYPSKKQYNLETAVFFLKRGRRDMSFYYYEKSRELTATTIEEAHINAAYIKWIESQKLR